MRELLGRILLVACRKGDKQLFESCLKKGAQNYESALLEACLENEREMAERLVKLGAKDFNGGLEMACKGGNYELAKLMVEKGATNVAGKNAKQFFEETFADKSELEIIVKMLTGKSVRVGVNLFDTVEELKGKVQDKEGLPPDSLRIVFAGRQLENRKRLAYYSIQKGSTVHLVLSMRSVAFNLQSVLQLGGEEISLGNNSFQRQDLKSVEKIKEKIQLLFQIPPSQQELHFAENSCTKMNFFHEPLNERLDSFQSFGTEFNSLLIKFKTIWTIEEHHFVDQNFKDLVLTFLLCMNRGLEKRLKLAKPILSIILNLCI